MGISIEVITCTLRCGSNHCKMGDPWDFCATVQIFDGVARLSAGCGDWRQWRRAVLLALRNLGIRRVELIRIGKNGCKRTIAFDL